MSHIEKVEGVKKSDGSTVLYQTEKSRDNPLICMKKGKKMVTNVEPGTPRKMVTNVEPDSSCNMVRIEKDEETGNLCEAGGISDKGECHIMATVANKYTMSTDELIQQNSTNLISSDIRIENGRVYFKNLVAFNFTIVIDSFINSIDDAGEEKQLFSITINVLRKEGMLKRMVRKGISRKKLISENFINSIHYCSTDLDRSSMLNVWYRYINFMIDNSNAPSVTIYDHAGWKLIQNQMLYVDGEKVIGFPYIKAKARTKRIIRKCQNKALKEIFERARSVLKRTSQMDVLLLYVFSSFLYKIFGLANVPLKFSLFIVGERGSQKTALATCFSQIENKVSPVLTFQATKAGIMSRFADYSDAVMLIDDLAPTTNMARRRDYEEKLEAIIRIVGDSTERVICTSFIDEEKKKPEYKVVGGCIFTGEYYENAGCESSRARTVSLEINNGEVNLDVLAEFQTHPEYVEGMLYGIIEYVSINYSKTISLINEMFSAYRYKYQNMFSNGRYGDYIGQLMATAAIIYDAFYEQNLMDRNAFLYMIEESVMDVLNTNDQKMRRKSTIFNLVAAIVFFEETSQSYRWGEDVEWEKPFIIYDDDFFYLDSQHLVDIQTHYFSKHGIGNVPLTTYEATNLLKNNGIITEYMEGNKKRYARKYSVYKGKRLLQLSKKAIEDIFNKAHVSDQ